MYLEAWASKNGSTSNLSSQHLCCSPADVNGLWLLCFLLLLLLTDLSFLFPFLSFPWVPFSGSFCYYCPSRQMRQNKIHIHNTKLYIAPTTLPAWSHHTTSNSNAMTNTTFGMYSFATTTRLAKGNFSKRCDYSWFVSFSGFSLVILSGSSKMVSRPVQHLLDSGQPSRARGLPETAQGQKNLQ